MIFGFVISYDFLLCNSILIPFIFFLEVGELYFFFKIFWLILGRFSFGLLEFNKLRGMGVLLYDLEAGLRSQISVVINFFG